MLDVGIPDGAVIGLAYRPAFWSRLQLGAGSNSISPGLRAGAVLVPFGMGPSLTVEGGWYFEGDANAVLEKLAGASYASNRTAQRVGYQFANLHLGMDFGSVNGTFFIHGGMSYLRTKLHDMDDTLGGRTVSSQGEVTTFAFSREVALNAFFPSFKLGFLVYLV
jgi:hypothetical protein